MQRNPRINRHARTGLRMVYSRLSGMFPFLMECKITTFSSNEQIILAKSYIHDRFSSHSHLICRVNQHVLISLPTVSTVQPILSAICGQKENLAIQARKLSNCTVYFTYETPYCNRQRLKCHCLCK